MHHHHHINSMYVCIHLNKDTEKELQVESIKLAKRGMGSEVNKTATNSELRESLAAAAAADTCRIDIE